MKLRATLFVLAVAASSLAQAQSRLEDILRNPTVARLLGQSPMAIVSESDLCANAAFRNANPTRCAAAADALRLQALPFELRAVLTNPASASALRQLCVSASPEVARTNYLCVELGKGDASLGVDIQNRSYQQAAGDQRP